MQELDKWRCIFALITSWLLFFLDIWLQNTFKPFDHKKHIQSVSNVLLKMTFPLSWRRVIILCLCALLSRSTADGLWVMAPDDDECAGDFWDLDVFFTKPCLRLETSAFLQERVQQC